MAKYQAAIHPEEENRVQALRALNILDSLPQAEFDEITFLASKICDTPVALVSLVDRDRQWFKSKTGTSLNETGRDIAFCAHAILQDEIFIVPDATVDDRFKTNPLVTGEANVEFYAGVPLLDPNLGLPIGTLCVIDNRPRDLSEEQLKALRFLKNQVERLLSLQMQNAKLARLQRQLEEAQRSTKLGHWSYDLKSKKIECSKQMLEFLPPFRSGYFISLDEFSSNIHPDDIQHWKSMFTEVLSGSEPTPFRLRRVHGDKLIWIETRLKGVMDSLGHITKVAGTSQDITENVCLEEQLEKKRIIAIQHSKLATLGEMSAGVAHEINNPLAILSGTIALLKKMNDDPKKLELKLDIMARAVERVSKIVRGLQKFSRSAEDLPREAAKISDIVSETSVLTETLSKRHTVTVEFDLQTDAKVECNAIEIEQVLINVIGNAIEAAKDSVEKNVIVQVFDNGADIVLRVIDSGPGVSPHVEGKLFEPFFTTKPVGEGTGLGLSISKGILESHGATIFLNRSVPGTCFEIRFLAACHSQGVA